MKIVKFLLALVTTGGLTWALNTSHNIKGVPLLALGSLLSPFEGYWHNGDKLTATPSDEILKGIKSTVKIAYDDRDVPHVFAETIEDAYFTQGFLHANNRLWQMEFLARAAGGGLSEVLGDRKITPSLSTVDVDKLSRRRGIVKGAERTVEAWKKDPEAWKLIESYAAGVNTLIGKLSYKDYPVEYKIFGVKPETWTPLKMALIVKYMALDLALGSQDMQATNAKALLGSDFDFVFPAYFKEQSPIIPTGTSFKKSPSVAPKTSMSNIAPYPLSNSALSSIHNTLLPFPDAETETQPDPSNGSNNWVVAASKTKNKRPILSGDPHLNLRLPAIWYEMELSTPEMNVYGTSIPGMPSIIIGFNDHIAWTPTNVGHDVVDWLSIKWKDASKMEYLLDGAYKKVETRIENINVKGGATVNDTVKYTVWGPVIYENDTVANANMAFRWLDNEITGLSPTVTYKLNKAKNYDDYAAAIQDWNIPAQNIAFACKDGDIALRVQGAFPDKPKGQGRFVQDGSLSSSSWKALIPKADIPFSKNPARGFVSSANQHSTDPSYPYYYHSENFEGYRGRIVNNLLSKSDSFTVEDMMKMQNDNSSLMAEEALPNMIKHLDVASLSAPEQALLADLQGWNKQYDADLTAPVVFEEWYNAFFEETWDEILSNPNAKRIMKPSTVRTVFLLRDEPNNKFFDNISTPEKETAKEICTKSFKKMAVGMAKVTAEIALKYPTNPKPTWSNYKDTEIPHISNIPGLGRTKIASGGQARSLNSIKKSNGPSWRMVVELGGDKPRAFVNYPGGQSGNPGNKHYAEFIDKWAKGEYYEAIFLRKADEKHERITSVQTFTPEK
ncbi:MAG: penicillin acylase family protein [Saprospiraceae bacterium]|nr:penicillin acylase family protein [Saprospiraceae bacterium]